VPRYQVRIRGRGRGRAKPGTKLTLALALTKLLVPRYQEPAEVEAEAAAYRPAWHVVRARARARVRP
jgi:hypothetical protein